MKFNKIFLGLACAAAMSFTACNDTDKEFADSITPADGVSATAVEFDANNKTTVELDPASPSFAITVNRKATDAASYAVKVIENEANSFVVPSTIEFAAGETAVRLPITMSETAEQGKALKLVLTFDDENLNPYTKGLKEITISTTIIKWETLGVGYWFGNVTNAYFTTEPQLLSVAIEKAETAAELKFRFESPYSRTATRQDELGAFDGYPYNDAADLNGVVENFVFNVSKKDKSVTFASAPVNLGINYGYGDFILTAASGKTGTFAPSEVGGIITFAASTLGLAMTEYNDGKYAACSKGPSTLYLTAADYKAAMKYEANIETDFEFEEEFSGEFTSGLLGKTSESSLNVGTCTETKDDCDKVFAEKYGKLYKLASPYAEDYHLTFCIKNGKIIMPEDTKEISYSLQATGLQALGKDVYAKINADESSYEEGLLTLNITFTDEDEEAVYGTFDEVLENVKWESLGTGTMTDDAILTLFNGFQTAPQTYEVEFFACEQKPGIIRVMNPYGIGVHPYAAALAGSGFTMPEAGMHLDINCADPDGVYIERQDLGIDLGDGPLEIISLGANYLIKNSFAAVKKAGLLGIFDQTTGMITFPVATASNGTNYQGYLFEAGELAYYMGTNSAFAFQVPVAAAEVSAPAYAVPAVTTLSKAIKSFATGANKVAKTTFTVRKDGKAPVANKFQAKTLNF